MNVLPDDIKDFLDGKLASITSVRINAWIIRFMDRNNVSQALRDEYATIKAQYQSGTLSLKHVSEWARTVLADISAQHDLKIDKIHSVFGWINSVLLARKKYQTSIEAATTVEELDAVTWDYSALNATDPDVWLEHVI